MKPIFLLVCIFFLSSSCTAKNYLYYKHTGYEINNKFKKLQGFNIDYEVENGGPIFNNEISIYKFSKAKCIIVSKIDGDSGVYGTETILYFSNAKILEGYRINYSYNFLDGEGSKKINRLNYEKNRKNENLDQLNKELNGYLKYINKKTLKECS